MAKIEWQVVYRDGTKLNQYNKDGTENSYMDIDRKNIENFILLFNLKPRVVIYFDNPEKKRLIYRKRVAQKVYSGAKEIVHLAGWQELRNGTNIQMVCFLFEDGHVEITDGFRKDHPWYRPVRFLPEEELEVAEAL